MFFNLFKKPDVAKESPNEDDNNIIAAITYCITKDSESPVINIEMKDYDEESCVAICDLLDILSEENSYVETINMLKSGLSQDGQQDLLIKIFTFIGQKAKDKILNAHRESVKDEPCIKPSDMLN
jgi:hypothetical protein